MNEGWLAIGVILATIGSGVVLVWYRDLIFSPGAAAPRRSRRQVKRRPGRAAARSSTTETPAKPAETASEAVSVVAIENDSMEMIAFLVLAKLIRARDITETVALEHAFDVKAGSSKAYKAAQAKLKRALEDLDPKVE